MTVLVDFPKYCVSLFGPLFLRPKMAKKQCRNTKYILCGDNIIHLPKNKFSCIWYSVRVKLSRTHLIIKKFITFLTDALTPLKHQ